MDHLSSKMLSVVALLAFVNLANAQVVDVTSDGTPVIGLVVSAAAIASGTTEDGGTVPPNASDYNYTTNGYVSDGALRGGTTDGSSFSGTYAALVDRNPATYGDTEYDGYNRTNTDGSEQPLGYDFGSAYVGLTGLSSVSTTTPITSIQLTFTLDIYEGSSGFFGDNGTKDVYQNTPGGDYFIHLPTLSPYQVQTTTDGTTWTTVASTSNYYALINNLDVGAAPNTVLNSPTVTFSLASPAEGLGIDGIRVVGTDAGGRDDGLLSVATLTVLAPEPSTYAMLVLGLGGLFLLARFARRTA
jgi:hypothetical protein